MERLVKRYREWAWAYALAHAGTEDHRIINYIDSLHEYADHLEKLNKAKPKGIINVWSNPISCFPGK